MLVLARNQKKILLKEQRQHDEREKAWQLIAAQNAELE